MTNKQPSRINSWLALALAFAFAAVLGPIQSHAQTFKVLYSFTGGDDGAYPSGLVLDPNGNLYGVAGGGGNSACQSGCGVVFEVTP